MCDPGTRERTGRATWYKTASLRLHDTPFDALSHIHATHSGTWDYKPTVFAKLAIALFEKPPSGVERECESTLFVEHRRQGLYALCPRPSGGLSPNREQGTNG